MSTTLTLGDRWRAWWRRYERAVAAAYLGGAVALLAAAAVPTLRGSALRGLERAVRWWDDRWARRLNEGERLVAAGRHVEAAAYLARLDQSFPARNVRHARDKQRERVLVLLGRSQEAIGQRRQAMATYQRLVAFDSLNYLNHFELAGAAERLLSGWAVAPEARDAFAAALRLLPSHLPSLRGYAAYYLDRGDFQPVVDAYQHYLDAFLVQRIQAQVGDGAFVLRALVDGRPQRLLLDLPLTPGQGGDLVLRTEGFPIALDSVTLFPARRVGRLAARAPVPVPTERLVPEGYEAAELGAWRPLTGDAALRVPLPELPNGTARIRLVLRLFKPVDRGLWSGVARSFKNLLDFRGLAQAEARTVTFGSAAQADRVLAEQEWVKEGGLPGTDEGRF